MERPFWLVTARSGLPSPLKSPAATEVGRIPAGKAGATLKERTCPQATGALHIQTANNAGARAPRRSVFILAFSLRTFGRYVHRYQRGLALYRSALWPSPGILAMHSR